MLMGLTSTQFWTGHFLSAFVVAVLEGICTLLVIYFSVEDFPPPAGLNPKQPRYAWLVFQAGNTDDDSQDVHGQAGSIQGCQPGFLGRALRPARGRDAASGQLPDFPRVPHHTGSARRVRGSRRCVYNIRQPAFTHAPRIF
ncbi:hypothetical protein MRX96_047218 [Rhipicephalus microplus]